MRPTTITTSTQCQLSADWHDVTTTSTNSRGPEVTPRYRVDLFPSRGFLLLCLYGIEGPMIDSFRT